MLKIKCKTCSQLFESFENILYEIEECEHEECPLDTQSVPEKKPKKLQRKKAVLEDDEILPGLSFCPGCRALPGHIHDDGCDQERCSGCGELAVACAWDNDNVCEVSAQEHDKYFARWTGLASGISECRMLGIDLVAFKKMGYGKIFFVKPI